MAVTITPSFVKQWSDDVKQDFQQRSSKLLENVRVHRDVIGSTYGFHKLASVEATTKARNADVTGLDPVSSVVNVTLADFYASVYLDKLDETKTNVDLRREYVQSVSAALSRKVDDVIISALDAATATTSTVTGGLTIPKIIEAMTYLNVNEVNPEDRILVISPKQLGEALQITQLTSADYVALQAIQKANIGSAFGFTWVVSNRLPKATTNRTCFAFNKQAIGVAIGADISTEINYIPEKVSTLVNSFVSIGAGIVDNAGITKITCVE